MSLIEWDHAKLSVGIESIDREHQVIVEFINDIAKNINKNAPADYLEMLFDRLISYTQYHFASEEAYFKHLSMQDVLLHRLQHKHFIEQLYAYKMDVHHNVTTVLLDNLLDWFVSHIQSEDRKLIQAINKYELL